MLKTKKRLVQAVRKSDKNCCPTFLHKLAQHATTRNRNVGIQGKATITNCKDGLSSLTPLLTLYSNHVFTHPPTSICNNHKFMLHY